jgi:hypothetical protein
VTGSALAHQGGPGAVPRDVHAAAVQTDGFVYFELAEGVVVRDRAFDNIAYTGYGVPLLDRARIVALGPDYFAQMSVRVRGTNTAVGGVPRHAEARERRAFDARVTAAAASWGARLK